MMIFQFLLLSITAILGIILIIFAILEHKRVIINQDRIFFLILFVFLMFIAYFIDYTLLGSLINYIVPAIKEPLAAIAQAITEVNIEQTVDDNIKPIVDKTYISRVIKVLFIVNSLLVLLGGIIWYFT